MLARPCREDLRELVWFYESRQLRVVIDSVFPLKEAGEAHRRIESGVDRGKIVLRIAEDG